MVIVPVCVLVVLELSETEYPTPPLPLPDPLPSIEIKDWLGVACQLQPAGAVTLMPPLPPLDVKLPVTPNPSVESVMPKVQTSPVSVIATVNAPLFMLSVACRVLPGLA